MDLVYTTMLIYLGINALAWCGPQASFSLVSRSA